MRGPGFFSMLQLAAGMSMAAPLIVVGIEFARTGQPVMGAVFFTFGLVALFAPSYVVRRIGGPRAWIKRRLRADGGADAREDDGLSRR